ncbi:hypothetical protein DFS34DRAFT_647656 [Phlyctochytrium arcticum]|nr:hypothetical protein DFS34DRAFT_647656 [Phlyctochytrium arcticum]
MLQPRSLPLLRRPLTSHLALLLLTLSLFISYGATETQLLYLFGDVLKVYKCEVTGECQTCPPLERVASTWCGNLGNKEPISCREGDTINLNEIAPENKWWSDEEVIRVSPGKAPELPRWQECDFVTGVETRRFFLFQIFNIVVFLGAVVVMLWRKRMLSKDNYRRLVMRLRG